MIWLSFNEQLLYYRPWAGGTEGIPGGDAETYTDASGAKYTRVSPAMGLRGSGHIHLAVGIRVGFKGGVLGPRP